MIASGSLANAEQLSELAEKGTNRQIIALVPAIDCGFRTLPLPKKNRRQAILALPYALEDDLAQDLSEIHLHCYAQHATTGDVIFVSHSKMEIWLQWLNHAGLQTTKLIPDGIALPTPTMQTWHFAQIEETWLVKQTATQVLAFDDEQMLNLWLKSQDLTDINCISLTPWTENLAQTAPAQAELAELPLAAFITEAISNPCNLRVREYQYKPEKQSSPVRPWLILAGLAASCLFTYLLSLGIQISELNTQEQELKAQIEKTYKMAYPNVKRLPNPKLQMTQELKKLSLNSAGATNSILDYLNDFMPAYQKISGFKVQAIRYDNKQKELRIQASGASFDKFEQLKSNISSDYQSELGALNQSGSVINGTIVMRK